MPRQIAAPVFSKACMVGRNDKSKSTSIFTLRINNTVDRTMTDKTDAIELSNLTLGGTGLILFSGFIKSF